MVTTTARRAWWALPQPPIPPSWRNLPNTLTLGRLLTVPVLAVLLLTAGDSFAARVLVWGLFTLACLTDILDGRLARSRGQVTSFGVIADPIADKALIAVALIGLSVLSQVPWWATSIVLGRELAVTLLRLALLRHAVLPAGRGGKLKALTQNIAVGMQLLPLSGLLAAGRRPVLLLAVALTVITGVHYALQALRLRAPAAQTRAA